VAFLLAATVIHYPKEAGLMSKAQEIHDRVEAVAAEQGITKKEAHKIVGKEFGMQPSSIRGAVYQARKANGLTRSRVQETTTDGAVASAIATLERARDAIDHEVEAAKERADEADREYKALQGSAKDRKAEIETKIKALAA
jgi:hydroxymethylpyrimidine/phosphomethylpyrimidine kinase